MTASRRDRAGVVLVDGGRVALIERHRDGLHYFVFPGGGVEPGESFEEAAVREAAEELGLEVRLGELIAEIEFGGTQRYFRASVVGGELGTGPGSFSGEGTYAPVWVGLGELGGLDVRPEELVAHL